MPAIVADNILILVLFSAFWAFLHIDFFPGFSLSNLLFHQSGKLILTLKQIILMLSQKRPCD
jgi:hypothetical protein